MLHKLSSDFEASPEDITTKVHHTEQSFLLGLTAELKDFEEYDSRDMTTCPQSRLLKSLLFLYLGNTCCNFRVSLLSKSVSPAPSNSHACGRQQQWQEGFLFSSQGHLLTLRTCLAFVFHSLVKLGQHFSK